MSRRVQVTVPEEILPLFDWMVKYDERFKGKEAAVVAHLLERGVRAAYAESLARVEPLDADDYAPLADHARATLGRVDE